MPGAIGSTLGSLGGTLGNLGFSNAATTLGNWGNWFSPTAAAAGPSDGGILPSGTGPMTPPGVDPTAVGPAYPPAGTPASPFVGPAAGNPPNVQIPSDTGPATAADQPEQSWWRQAIQALTGKEVGKGGGGAALTDVGNLADQIQRYMIMRRLQDPSQVLKQSQVLGRGLSKGLKRDVGAATGQEMAEAGLAGAPGLYSQAVASALAPYRFQEQQNALQQYLEAMRLSGAMYPGEGGMYGPSGGYGQYPGEQSQQAQSSPS